MLGSWAEHAVLTHYRFRARFLESESDLDAEVRNLMALTSAPNLYPELIRLGAVGSILSLLSHENTDVVLSTIELLNELTDEEIVPEEDGEAEEQGVKELVKALEEAQALELVVQNLVRFDETKDDDRRGVFNVLGWCNCALFKKHRLMLGALKALLKT